MADWKEIFSKTMLANGRAYFDSGKAKKLQRDDDGYSATVRGTRNYKVRIDWNPEDEDEIASMECTCTNAREGNVCKHMAAVLYLIDAEDYPMRVEEEVLKKLRRNGGAGAAGPAQGSPAKAGSAQAGAAQGSPAKAGSAQGSPAKTGSAQGGAAQGSPGKGSSAKSTPAQGGAPAPAKAKQGTGKNRNGKKAGSGASLQRAPASSADPSEIPDFPFLSGLTELRREEAARLEKEQREAQEQAAAKLPPRHMEPYRYFHYENFEKGLNIDPAKRKKAKQLLKNGDLKNMKVQIGYPRRNPWDRDEGPVIPHGFVTARFDNGYEQVRLVFDSDRIKEVNCSYWKCRGSSYEQRLGEPVRVCEHGLALLEMAKEYLEENNPGDATSWGGLSLLGSAGQGQYALEDAGDFDAPAVAIEPVIDYPETGENTIPTVSFRTGTARMYKVKKIAEYVNAMKAGEEMQFGTKTMIRLGEELLASDSAPWYRFMQDALREEEQRNRALSANISGSRYYQGSFAVGEQIADAIPLYGAALDRFYRMAEGKRIEFSIRSGTEPYYGKRADRRKALLLFCEQELHVQIEVSPLFGLQMADSGSVSGKNAFGENASGKNAFNGNSFGDHVSGETGPLQGIRITGELPRLIEGQDASYFIDEVNERFCRVDRGQIRKIEPLLEAMENGRIDARIGRRHLRDFYNRMMPRLREAADVIEYGADLVESYLPPEPEFFYYFDIEDGDVLCRPDVHYGLQIHTILDLVPDAPWHAQVAEYRDQDLEMHALNAASKYINSIDPVLRVLILPQGEEEQLFNLLAYGLEELMGIGEVRMTEAFRRLGLRRHMKFSVGVSVESNLMDLQILSEDLSEEELLAVFYQYQKKRKFVRLKNGDFLQLDKNETIERLLEIMETMGVSLKEFVRGKMQVPAYRALYLDKMLEQMQDVYTDRDRRFKALIKEFKTVEDADFEVPASLRGTLRKYQVAGYRWLRTLDQYGFGGILADEMGLGKTLQVIAVLLADKQAREEAQAPLPGHGKGDSAQPALPDHGKGDGAQPALPDHGTETARATGEAGVKETVLVPEKTGSPSSSAAEPAAKNLPVPAASTVAEIHSAAAAKKRDRPSKKAAAAVAPAAQKKKEKPVISCTSLVVCPASLVYNWGEELRRFAPQLRACLVTGMKKERAALIQDYTSYDVLVTSYDLLKRDIDEYEGKGFRFEIIDEAQYIKNHSTAAAKSVKLITAQTRFALTGTPIENRLSELWSIFDYLMPGFLYTYAHFSADLEMPIVKFQDEAAAERLRRMASPFILRRRKEDVLRDLPEKLEEVRYAGMDAKQRKLYDGQVVRMKTDMKGQSESDFRKKRIQILAELTRIRQICCDPSLILANYDGGSAKRETCMELIRNVIEGEHKALVFSQFASMLELLEADLKKENIDYFKITGATPKERRMEMVKTFNSDRTPVFLISLKAGGTGLNLTGADVVIHYDPWWNVAAQNQATDRAHRIGQTRIVTVYKLIVKDTIEERILEMQENKKQLAEDILSSESISSSTISREDLLELLG